MVSAAAKKGAVSIQAPEPHPWYRKGIVQAAIVAGIFGIVGIVLQIRADTQLSAFRAEIMHKDDEVRRMERVQSSEKTKISVLELQRSKQNQALASANAKISLLEGKLNALATSSTTIKSDEPAVAPTTVSSETTTQVTTTVPVVRPRGEPVSVDWCNVERNISETAKIGTRGNLTYWKGGSVLANGVKVTKGFLIETDVLGGARCTTSVGNRATRFEAKVSVEDTQSSDCSKATVVVRRNGDEIGSDIVNVGKPVQIDIDITGSVQFSIGIEKYDGCVYVVEDPRLFR
jgi:hypothetical protein